jgi:hypothetical protein
VWWGMGGGYMRRVRVGEEIEEGEKCEKGAKG